MGPTPSGKIFFIGKRNSFPQKLTLIEKGNKNKYDRVASPESLSIYLNLLTAADVITLKRLNIGTPKTINFPFVPNGKLMIFRCPSI